MSRAALEQALRLAGGLSAQELEQLGTKIAALRALLGPAAISHPLGAAGPAVSGAFPELLYGALTRALARGTSAWQPPYGPFLRTRTGRLWPPAAAVAWAAHLGWFPTATRQQTAVVCHIYAACLLSYVGGVPRWPQIISAVGNLPEVVDRSFPGYARSGLLSLLLKPRHQLPVDELGAAFDRAAGRVV